MRQQIISHIFRALEFLLVPLFVACCLCASTGHLHAQVTFDWVTVGDQGNAPDQDYGNGQFGAVDYNYRISKHEVTNDQYSEFLNAVAVSDANNLFNGNMDITRSGVSGSFDYSVNSGFGPNPVNYVSFFDAMRFVNWLENGQGMGSTESGVYTISDGLSEARDASATYFIPSEDEWYKSAYYDPRLATAGGPPGDDNYWLFPTQNDTTPTAEAPVGGTNSANFGSVLGDTTDVGAYLNTTGFYGTFDQAGNVWEWNESVVNTTLRGMRGGSWFDGAFGMEASFRLQRSPTNEDPRTGFRVASVVPEPASLLLGAWATIGLLLRRRR